MQMKVLNKPWDLYAKKISFLLLLIWFVFLLLVGVTGQLDGNLTIVG